MYEEDSVDDYIIIIVRDGVVNDFLFIIILLFLFVSLWYGEQRSCAIVQTEERDPMAGGDREWLGWRVGAIWTENKTRQTDVCKWYTISRYTLLLGERLLYYIVSGAYAISVIKITKTRRGGGREVDEIEFYVSGRTDRVHNVDEQTRHTVRRCVSDVRPMATPPPPRGGRRLRRGGRI